MSFKENSKNSIFWLEDVKENILRPQLEETKRVDIAILGAGYTGLWTAYYLLEQSPSLEIAILEQEEVGHGASGRNGGWVTPKFSVTPSMTAERFGKDTAKQLFKSMAGTVNEIENVIKKENMDVDWHNSGSLKVSIGQHLYPDLEKEMEVYKYLELEDEYQLLSEKETDKRVHIEDASGSILTKSSASIHPAKLVKSLARILERKGVTIYENTKVTKYVEGNNKKKPFLVTKKGNLIANKSVVIAGEAFLSQLSAYNRKIIPMYTSIVLTEPLSEDQWKDIGWENRETIGSNHLSTDYLQRTADNRILFGLGNSSPYQYGSKMSENYTTYGPSISLQKNRALEWFPTLRRDQFVYEWGGPIGVTRDWTPNITYDDKTGIAQAWGFAGQGVSTTNLAGRILTDLIHGENTLETSLPMVHHTSPKWEPEPFRWIGAKYIKSSINNLDERSETKGIAPTGKSLAERLIKH